MINCLVKVNGQRYTGWFPSTVLAVEYALKFFPAAKISAEVIR